MKRLQFLCAASTFALATLTTSTASAGDVRLSFDGDVSNVLLAGLQTGDIASATVGDSVRFDFEVTLPGQGVSPDGERLFPVDVTKSVFVAGAGSVEGTLLEPVDLLVGNNVAFPPNFPSTDFMLAFFKLPSGQRLELLVENASGVLFDSNELSAITGTYALSAASKIWVYEAGSDTGIEVELTSLAITDDFEVGAPYCGPAVVNSSGAAATIAGVGSTLVAANDLRIEARDVPAGQFALLLVSRTEGFVMPVNNSQGALCLGGDIGRANGTIANSGALGQVAYDVDLTMLPQPNQVASAAPGETWRFQVWFRDLNPGSTSNFTDALAVTFD